MGKPLNIFSIAAVALLFSFLPYVNLLGLESDIQPNAILFTTLFIVFNLRSIRLYKHDIYIIVPLLVSVILLFVTDAVSGIRSLAGIVMFYSTVLMVRCIYLSKKGRKVFDNVAIVTYCMWLAFGLLQVFFGNDILDVNVGTVQLSTDRGNTSLAPEPYYYGVAILFYLLIFYVTNKGNYFIYVSGVAQILLLSRSVQSILILSIFMIVFAIINFNKNRRQYVLAIVVMFTLIGGRILSSGSLWDPNSRISSVLSLALDNPTNLISKDGSGSVRAAHIVVSLSGFIENYGLPRGFDSWQSYYQSKTTELRSLFYYVDSGDRIHSLVGTLLFELGIFGGFILYYIFSSIWYRRRSNIYSPSVSTFVSIGIIILSIGALPLGTPYIGILVGLFQSNK